MKRRSFIRNTGLTLGAFALLNQKSFAAFLSDPAYNIKMLTDNIGIFTEKGGTILFMISKEGTVVVDTQFPDTAAHLVEEIKKKTDQYPKKQIYLQIYQPIRKLIDKENHNKKNNVIHA